MTAILQSSIPYHPLAPRRLPGIAPLDMADWLQRDDAFAAQMAERDRLIATRRAEVLALDDAARPAAVELLETVLDLAYPGATGTVRRPDGVGVTLDRGDPLGTLGRLVQEDLCILEKRGAEHVLTGAVLCFPASWTLSEKFLRPLIAIHTPVDSYDANMATRVQRLFDGVQPGRPLWRSNALWYADPDLHQPRREADPRPEQADATLPYLRSERQSVLRLPRTRAVVFSIHTYVLARADMQGLADAGRAGA
ncbi:heme-dependent oxidative N-demethylase family protein [Pukyongiella litopenaei]|uniref:DUF3445 domain-containing protein n=1 Tax=Pukyongiella litopenaei TaxID=2605946 RepID=A0A2S0MN89_9RHOB|nr:DUF3445 domain-containing protein [Pukyongiella litopenaei]AVO37297.1 DUF3445 domain-containing protein [Pukyongiella litopenaei]